ncbi:MAG: hypothetical protein U1E53_15990 [Dongiaceae bacterium]
MDRYYLVESGTVYGPVEAPSLAAALDLARRNVDPGSYERNQTVWVTVEARAEHGDETASATVRLDPEEPGCAAARHDWRVPHAVLELDPGEPAAGAAIVEVCAHCGRRKVTSAHAQDPETGDQCRNGDVGTHSIRYFEPGEPS